jgi:hypothetical protein
VRHKETSPNLLQIVNYQVTKWLASFLLEKLTALQVIFKFSLFYGTRKFVAMFTRAYQLSEGLNKIQNTRRRLKKLSSSMSAPLTELWI